jgi:hypothetical protein
VIKIFVAILALAVAASTQAMALDPQHLHAARMTKKEVGDGGCGRGFHRGVGGNCVLNPTDGPYRPDPYWTPCDYSLGPQYPEGCGF